MARLFDDASNQYLSVGSVPVTSAPFTFSCWFNVDDTAVENYIMRLWLDGNNYWVVFVNNGPSTYVRMALEAQGVEGTATTSTYAVINTWNHACIIERSSTDRSAFLNAGGEGTDSTNLTPTAPDTTYIAATGSGLYYSGMLAELAFWNTDLTDAEVAILAAGVSALYVRPASLVFYCPLIRDADEDWIGGLSLTAYNSPTVSGHPSVAPPLQPQLWAFPPVAASGLTVIMDTA